MKLDYLVSSRFIMLTCVFALWRKKQHKIPVRIRGGKSSYNHRYFQKGASFRPALSFFKLIKIRLLNESSLGSRLINKEWLQRAHILNDMTLNVQTSICVCKLNQNVHME